MKQRTLTYKRKRMNWRRLYHAGWLLAVLLFLVACSLLNRGPILGDTADLQGSAVVTCSTACAERGQCGTKSDGARVALAGATGPMLENHERVFAAGAVVNILESREETVEIVKTAEQFPLRFYHIRLTEAGDGWIAGWCLAAQ